MSTKPIKPRTRVECTDDTGRARIGRIVRHTEPGESGHKPGSWVIEYLAQPVAQSTQTTRIIRHESTFAICRA